jgi:hypothetical protein
MADDRLRQLQAIVHAHPVLAAMLGRWSDIALPSGWLAAGAVAQAVWNSVSGLPPLHGLSDVDVVYFDAGDVSEATEADHAARVRRLFPDVPVRIDVKNEARVHLWYEAKFGKPLAPFASAEDAISTFPTTATAVGVRSGAGGLEIYAPLGLDDLLGLIVRANKKQISRSVYEAKIARWQPLWPRLRVVPWDQP